MLPSSPLDLIWRVFAPLAWQLEAVGHVLEACAAYYSWCAGCATGLAFLLLTGLVVQEARDGGSADGPHEAAKGASEPQRARGVEHVEWGLSG